MSADLRILILALLAGLQLAGCGAPLDTANPTPPSAATSTPSPAQAAAQALSPESLPPLQPITAENAESVRLLRTMEIPGYRRGPISQCSVAFSPDGHLLVGACGIAQVPVWEVESGQLQYQLYEASQQIVACSFAPNGETLAIGGFDNSVTLWDLETGERTGDIGPYDSPVWDIAFSPDGHSLVAGNFGMGSGSGNVHLSDVLDGQSIWNYAGPGLVLSVSYHPSDEILAWGDARGGVGLLDAAAGDVTLSLDQGRQPVGDVAFSPTGALLAAASDDHNIYLWNTSDYQLITALEGHRHYVNGVAFSPDESLLVSGSHDQTLRIWNLSTYQPLVPLEGHTDVVLRVAFSPDGTLIASISWDGTVRLWGVSAE